MKKSIFLLILFISTISIAQSNADDVLGTWYTSDKTGTIMIFKYNNKYFGKAASGPEINNFDVKNPDESKRTIKLKDVIFLQNFTFNAEKKKYMNGSTYNTEDGKTYKSWIKLKDKNSLELHGYVGFSMLGKSVHWTRKK